MKKNLIISILLLSINQICHSQTLSNWKHYYQSQGWWYNMGNTLATGGPEEIIEVDKSTMAITRYPFPDYLREVNPHNSLYYNFQYGFYEYCMPYVEQGPGQSLIAYFCSGDSYLFTNGQWQVFNDYLGFKFSNCNFLPYEGGSTFFETNGALYKYNGTTLSYYDYNNSPYDGTEGSFIAPDDSVLFYSDTSVWVHHNGAWLNFDSSYFKASPAYIIAACADSSGNFTFYNYEDSTFYSFVNSSGTWQTLTVPTSMIHQHQANIIGMSMVYDFNNNLWLEGMGIFCRYDGSQFYDYFNYLPDSLQESFPLIQTVLANNNLFLVNGNSYIFNTTTYTTTLFTDPQNVLPGNSFEPCLKDNNGNLWFGNYNNEETNGLIEYSNNGLWNIKNIPSYMADESGVQDIIQDTGSSITFGCSFALGPINLSGNNFNLIDSTTAYPYTISSICLDNNHNYWYGGANEIGAGGTPLTECSNGVVTTYTNSTSSNLIYAVEADSLGNIWVSYDSFDGVYKFDGTNWTHYYTGNSPILGDTVIDIILQPNTNTLWFCINNAGFSKYDNGIWNSYNMSNTQLPSNNDEYVYWDQYGTQWFTTQEGFASLDGTSWNTYTVYNSPLDNSDCEGIVSDNNGNVWIPTEAGITCATEFNPNAPRGEFISGKVNQSNGSPAINTLVDIYKLNSSGKDVAQIDNVFTDSAGKFNYLLEDTGNYYFEAVITPAIYPNQLTVYEDSALVIQQSSSIHVTGNAANSITIKLRQAASSPGSCTFNGKLNSTIEQVGGVRLVLMLNGTPVASELSNVNGSFTFGNLTPGNYSLWVDKLGLNNSVAPVVSVNCTNGNPVYYNFYLFSTFLSLSGVNQVSVSNQFNIYPNPASNNVTVVYSIQDMGILEIFDILGCKEMEFNLSPNINLQNINIKNLAPGMYEIRLMAGNNVATKKLVKE